MFAKLAMHVSFTWPAARNLSDEPVRLGRGLIDTLHCVAALFRNPVSQREMTGLAYNLYCDKPLVCFNWQFLSHELANTPAEAQALFVHVTPAVRLVDHTTLDHLIAFGREFHSSGRGPMEIVGLEQFWSKSDHATSMHRATTTDETTASWGSFGTAVAKLFGVSQCYCQVSEESSDSAEAGLSLMGLTATEHGPRDTQAELAECALTSDDNGRRDLQVELERMALTPHTAEPRIV
jgi:hypothetical protein